MCISPAAARWLRPLPCLLLLAVAIQQLWLVHVDALSPWAGGGFGMFATLDAGGTRHLHAFQQRPGVHREVQLPASRREVVRRVLALPSHARMQSLALELAEIPAPDYGPATSILVQVWQTHHDPATLTPRSRILRSLEVPLRP